MVDTGFLQDLMIVFGASALAVLALSRLRVPPLVGFILAGVLIGPHGMGFIEDVHDIEVMAEMGVILLLFTIGIEFSIEKLLSRRRDVILGGGAQVGLSVLVAGALGYLVTGDMSTSVMIGMLAALSSTAIVMKVLMQRGELDAPHGRKMFGILIMQDLCVVPFMLLLPALSGQGVSPAWIAWTVLKVIAILALVMVGARWLVPRLLHQVVHTRSRELFIIAVIFLCLGIALLTSEAGLSLALGAFLAGLIISESEYAHQALADVLPFKEGFLSLFFISIGMLLDVSDLLASPLTVAIAVVGIIGVKTATTALAVLVSGGALRIALQTGLGLAQVGEFSFVLAAGAKQAGIITEGFFQIFLSAAVITMMLTPMVLNNSFRLLMALPIPRFGDGAGGRGRPEDKEDDASGPQSGHVIIVGFGVNGRNLANALKASAIPYVVLELNSSTVRREKKRGEPMHYGDGTSTEILEMLGLSGASVLAVTIPDAAAARRIVATARRHNHSLHIVVRTRYINEIDDLVALGADKVIPEEFETSVEIFSWVLHMYNVPRNVILDHIEQIRRDSYGVLRGNSMQGRALALRDELMHGIQVDTLLVKEGSRVTGRSIGEMQLRNTTGTTLLAVRRGQEILQNPRPSFVIEAWDVLLLLGTRDDINRALYFIEPGE